MAQYQYEQLKAGPQGRSAPPLQHREFPRVEQFPFRSDAVNAGIVNQNPYDARFDAASVSPYPGREPASKSLPEWTPKVK